MATLITIGTTTINLDQVTELDDHGDVIRVFYAVGLYAETDKRQDLAYSEFRGEEAEALRWWVEHNATDIAKVKAVREASNQTGPNPSPGHRG